jgi:hypothetical protein
MVEILAVENDESDRLSAPEPMIGSIPQWQLPPSYRAFLACCSGLSISWDTDDDDNFLSTNHLVPFAGGTGEFVWCFDVTQPDSRGAESGKFSW